jgi:hypothetical protein
VRGTAPHVDCWHCHWFDQQNLNAKYVSPDINGAGGAHFVVGYLGTTDLVKPDRTGVCQVCHTLTKYWGATYDWQAPATGEHFRGMNCLTCHPHFPTDAATTGMFAPQMVGPQSHATHLSDCKGPRLSSCNDCHSTSGFSLFTDGQPLETTAICDPCHSRGGAYDGVGEKNIPGIGAKPNWLHGVYDGAQLKAGLEHWCDTCHDAGTSVVDGVQAPNVVADNSTSGYNVNGHGRNSSNYVGCLQCHTAACTTPGVEHCDGNARTYTRALWPNPGSNYISGYRLGGYMNIPVWNQWGATNFTLCLQCHDAGMLFDTGGIIASDFRNDRRHMWNTIWSNNLHYLHLYAPPPGALYLGPFWDSDWNGSNNEGGGDSTVSCPACHNVHGGLDPAGKMLRNGEPLVATLPNLHFNWYSAYDMVTKTGTTTSNLADSLYGVSAGLLSGFGNNHICQGCHGTGSDVYFRVPHSELQTAASTQTLYNAQLWTSDSADNPKTSFKRGTSMRVHLTYYVLPYSSPPPYNVFRKVTVFGGSQQNKATGQPVGSYDWHFDFTVPTGGGAAYKTVQSDIWAVKDATTYPTYTLTGQVYVYP